MADDEKAVHNTKPERWDGETVQRRNDVARVSDERLPLLDAIRISRRSPDSSNTSAPEMA